MFLRKEIFSANLLDVPVGTAVFTENKWSSLKNAHMNSTIVEYIEGIEVIKAFGRVGTFYEKYHSKRSCKKYRIRNEKTRYSK